MLPQSYYERGAKRGSIEITKHYRKLNEGTSKDHFPLPFIDQMLEKLATHEYHCCLNKYYDYKKISLVTQHQEKTTFICPYETLSCHFSNMYGGNLSCLIKNP
ncbi:hypothetical protein CR513_11272, partial [Mucuna pruriens]